MNRLFKDLLWSVIVLVLFIIWLSDLSFADILFILSTPTNGG